MSRLQVSLNKHKGTPTVAICNRFMRHAVYIVCVQQRSVKSHYPVGFGMLRAVYGS